VMTLVVLSALGLE